MCGGSTAVLTLLLTKRADKTQGLAPSSGAGHRAACRRGMRPPAKCARKLARHHQNVRTCGGTVSTVSGLVVTGL